MDIGSGSGYPAGALSNFSPYKFKVEGIECASMEGFLQSLKYSNPYMQVHICSLVGKQAKFKGKKKKWYRTQTLYWKGKEINRHSDEYQALLDKAFKELCKNKKFRKALLATGKATLKHSMGNKDPSRTVLTTNEFCRRLTKMRKELLKQSK